MKAYFRRLVEILANKDTEPSRIFIALVDIFFAHYMTSGVSVDDFAVMFTAFNHGNEHMVWIDLLLTHATMVLRGLTGKYGFMTYMLEGALGVFIWSITAITHTMAQGTLGPTFAVFLMAAWICARHPLDWNDQQERRNG